MKYYKLTHLSHAQMFELICGVKIVLKCLLWTHSKLTQDSREKTDGSDGYMDTSEIALPHTPGCTRRAQGVWDPLIPA